MHYPLVPPGQFKYTTPRSLVVILDRENFHRRDRFKYMNCIFTTIIDFDLFSNPINVFCSSKMDHIV